jgi:hypothetical protein
MLQLTGRLWILKQIVSWPTVTHTICLQTFYPVCYAKNLNQEQADQLGAGAHADIDARFLEHVQAADYSCGAFKINCAVSELPDFLAAPNVNGQAGPQHRGTIHFENHMDQIEVAAAQVLVLVQLSGVQ